jgi:hypothetical protein
MHTASNMRSAKFERSVDLSAIVPRIMAVGSITPFSVTHVRANRRQRGVASIWLSAIGPIKYLRRQSTGMSWTHSAAVSSSDFTPHPLIYGREQNLYQGPSCNRARAWRSEADETLLSRLLRSSGTKPTFSTASVKGSPFDHVGSTFGVLQAAADLSRRPPR